MHRYAMQEHVGTGILNISAPSVQSLLTPIIAARVAVGTIGALDKWNCSQLAYMCRRWLLSTRLPGPMDRRCKAAKARRLIECSAVAVGRETPQM